MTADLVTAELVRSEFRTYVTVQQAGAVVFNGDVDHPDGVPLADAAGKALAEAGWQVTSGWVQEHGGPVVCVWTAQVKATVEAAA